MDVIYDFNNNSIEYYDQAAIKYKDQFGKKTQKVKCTFIGLIVDESTKDAYIIVSSSSPDEVLARHQGILQIYDLFPNEELSIERKQELFTKMNDKCKELGMTVTNKRKFLAGRGHSSSVWFSMQHIV